MQEQNSKRLKQVIRAVTFVLLSILIMYGLSCLVKPREAQRLSKIRSYEASKVFNEKDNSLDVIFFGHSGVYSGISPMELYRDFGITSYNCSQSKQLPWESQHWLESLLKVQNPKLVAFEVGQLFYDKQETVRENSMLHFMYETFPVFLNHIGWKDWFDGGKDKVRSYTKGYYHNISVDPYKGNFGMGAKDKVYKIKKKHMKALERFYEICQKENIELLLFQVPSTKLWDYSRLNAVEKLKKKKNVRFLAGSQHLEEFGLDWKKDTRDRGNHLNHSGAKKFTKYLGEYIKSNFEIPDRRQDEAYSYWNKDLARYEEMIGEKSSDVQKN